MTPRLRPADLGFGDLFDRVADGIVVADVDTDRIMLANQAAERIFGYAAAELIGQPVSILAPERMRARHQAGMARYKATGHAALIEAGEPIEVPAVTKAGQEFWIELTLCASDPTPDGRRHVVSLIRDVTERKRGQEALEALNAQLREQAATLERERSFTRSLLDNLPAAVGFTSKDLILRLVNKEWAARHGKAPEDFIGKHVTEAFPAEIVAQFQAQVDQLMQRGEPLAAIGLPVVLRDEAGTRTTYQDVTAIPLRDEHGAIAGSLSLSFDATARVTMERELAERTRETEEQRALLSSIIDQVPAGIAFLDRELRVRWISPEYLRLTHMPAEHYLGRHLFADVAPEARAKFEPILHDVMATRTPYKLKALHYPIPVDGALRDTFWDFTYVPVTGAAGELSGVLVFALDISERVVVERLQAERIATLEQADALKDQFLSILSHELRTPLNGILGFASILEDEVAGPMTGDQHRHLRRILGGSEMLLALINDLLDMSRIQAGMFALDLERTDLGPVCHTVLDNLGYAADQKRLTLSRDIAPDLPPLVADPQRIGQVLYNLVYNAIKFTPNGGAIAVRVRAGDGRIRCEVQDTGIGIDEADFAKLFQRFVQLDGSRTRAVGGTGLGLSITKALVEAHGGEVGVESTPGAGSTFWFTLQAAEA